MRYNHSPSSQSYEDGWGFFFWGGFGCWKLAEKGGTGARQHRLLEWSNPISQQFPTRGHEPKQVLSSKTPIFPKKKKKKTNKSSMWKAQETS